MEWRVKPVLPVLKLIGAVAVAALTAGFAGDDPVRWALGGITAASLAGWAARDLLAPVRLTADEAGVTVLSGLLRRRRLPWSQIERVRVERTVRRGLRAELLEIDAGDAIFLLSEHELNARPEDVVAALADLRFAS